MSLPDDLRVAYEIFTLLATKYEYFYAGLLVSASLDDPSLMIIGNVSERGHALAEVFRQYAKILDDKTDAGQVQVEIPRNVN